MADKKSGLEFYFQPFSALEYKPDTPIICIVFENQPDLILTKSFPEVEAIRARFDTMQVRGDETVTIFNVQKDGATIPLVVIYIREPWRRKRGKNQKDIVENINLYREVWERTFYATRRLRAMHYTKLVLILPSRFQPDNIRHDHLQERRLEKFVKMVSEAIVTGNHSLDDFKQEKSVMLESVTFTYFGVGGREVDEFFHRSLGEGGVIGEAHGFVRRLTMLPPNAKYPLSFVEEATGCKLRVNTDSRTRWRAIRNHTFSSRTKFSFLYGKQGIENFGLGLIAAVGRGSAHDPVFLKAHYRPDTRREKPVKKIVVIGKGVTFDTGGYDLKLGDARDRMHYDVAGGATALGVIKIAEAMNLPVEIVALVPVVENAIGPHAVQKHEVVRSYNGKTVEIVDTDAEGRLIMADAIAYSERHLRPDCTITVGSLCSIDDFGPDFIKVVVGNDRLIKKVKRAEWASSEKMILFPRLEHFNWVDNEHVGSISDLLGEPEGVYYHVAPFVFLSNFFVYEEPEWIFVDISAVFESDADNYGAGPGFGLKFVWNLVKQFA